MGGLLNTLDIASSALAASRQGVEVSGFNLSNVNNPNYARARVVIEPRRDPTGTGAGVQVVGVVSLRDTILDEQVIRENSGISYLQNYQRALQLGQVLLGQQIDRQSATPEAEAAARDLGGQMALANGISEFFNAMQAASVAPASSAERQVLLLKADQLAQKFNSVDERIGTLQSDIDNDLQDRLKEANNLIEQIAKLANDASAVSVDGSSGGVVKDTLQTRMEDLAKLVSFQSYFDEDSHLTLSVNGVDLVSSNAQSGHLETLVGKNGHILVQAVNDNSGTKADVEGKGGMRGLIDARDQSLKSLKDNIDSLAATFIEQFNAIHATGTNLDGTKGNDFFLGSGSGDIRVNAALLADVRKVQLSGNGSSGDNGVALKLARLMEQPQEALDQLTFSEHYNETVVSYGQELSNINNRLADQEVISHTLGQQRNSVIGVSIDEEMSALVQYQRAYQASARLITTINELFATLLNV